MKKEPYFQVDTINQKSIDLLTAVNKYRSRHSGYKINQNHLALLVLDMQGYFLEERSHAYLPSSNAILPGVNKLVETFYQYERPVVFTRHINTTQDAGLLSTWWKDLIQLDNPTSEIISSLDVTQGTVLIKNQYDAFLNTSLADTLHAWEINQVVICGVMTHLCCESTARSAFMQGFEVYFTIDGTATYTEEFHRATLLNLSHGFAIPLLINEVMQVFH